MDRIYGRKPVLDTLDSDIEIYRAYILRQNSKIIDKLIKKLRAKNIEIDFVDKNFFDKIDMNHQGVALDVESFKYKDLADIDTYKRLIILDQIEDPHNLGAIVRPIVYKTSAGAINNINIIRVKNISRTIEEIQKEGFWVYGLAGEGSQEIDKTDLKGKIALVVGNEGKGISRLVREKCDILINIPMKGFVNSLNASVASAIAMYEVLRQNGFD